MLQIWDSEWSNDPVKLKEATTDYFTELYRSGGPRNFQPIIDQCPSVVREEMNEALTARITLQGVKNAVFQSGAVKALGPDGLNGQFYQHHWMEIHNDVLKMVNDFMETGI